MKPKDFFKDAIFWARIILKKSPDFCTEDLTPPSKRKAANHILSASEQDRRTSVELTQGRTK